MTKKLYLNGAIIDVKHGSVWQKGGMMTDGEIITAVGRAEDFPNVPDGAPGCEIDDCSGKTIMPGLINGHVHLFMEPYTWDRLAYQSEPLSSLCLRILDNMKKTLHSGVTFVRDLGGVANLDVEFRNYVEEGRAEGPRMFCARRPLTITGGHAADFSAACDGPAEFIKGVREQIRGGADLIKIMPTAGYARPKMRVNHSMIADTAYMSPEEIKAAADEAHRFGRKIAAHCCGLTGVKNAVLNGVDSIEHGQLLAPRSDEAKQIASEMAERGIWLVPTLSAFFKEYPRAEVEEKYVPVIESFRMYHESGVKIAMGTDAGVPWVGHDKAARETQHMSLYGMSAMEAIAASTIRPAEMMGIDGEYGSIDAGKFADFLILDEDPLCDIAALGRTMQVFKHGAPVAGGAGNKM